MADFGMYMEPPRPGEEYILPAFSVPILHLRVVDWEEKKKALLDIYAERSQNKKVFKTAIAQEIGYDVETDYHYNHDNHLTEHAGYDGKIEQILEDELGSVCDAFQCAVAVNTSWFEKARKGAKHEVHNHGVEGLSAVCFVDFDPKYHMPTIFCNPLLADATNTNFVPPNVDEGSLIVFPSYVLHFTQSNLSDVERLILSFNLQVDYGCFTFEEECNEKEEYQTSLQTR